MEILTSLTIIFISSTLLLYRGSRLFAFTLLFFMLYRRLVSDGYRVIPTRGYSWIGHGSIELLAIITLALFSLKIINYIHARRHAFAYVMGNNNRYPPTKDTQELTPLLLRPSFFPCQTSHSRIFPVKNSFKYSYLLTGVPVGFRGSVGGMISVDDVTNKRTSSWIFRLVRGAWYTVNGDDYLARGHHPDGLLGKLRDYLQSQGIDPKKYSHAYLLTAAKFLNYSSNPVSIWYLFSSINEISAVILEVNNTFDERHSYFLHLAPNKLPKLVNTAATATAGDNSSIRFNSTWPKDFYVSTFNDRSGRYFLSMNDPFAPNQTGKDYLNMKITLSGPSGENAMLVTLLRSTMAPLNPETMSIIDKIKFLSQWWWVGLATFPRTIFQALNLLFCKNLRWVSRPEPRRHTLSRHADETERCIENEFRNFLKYRVENQKEQYEKSIALNYKSGGLKGDDDLSVTFRSSCFRAKEIVRVEIRILTPSFYSHIVQHISIIDALISESTPPDCTVSFSDPENILSKVLAREPLPSSLEIPSRPYSNAAAKVTRLSSKFLLNFFGCLRRHRGCNSEALPKNFGWPLSHLSDLDMFVLRCVSSSSRLRTYVFNTSRLMILENIAFGSLIIWDLEVLVVRIIAGWLLARKISDLFLLLSS